MGVRSNVEILFQLGEGNSLDPGRLVADVSLEELLDTIARARQVVGELAVNQANFLVDKGDITTIRLLYIEADNDLDFYLGGSAPTTAEVTGVGASFPTGFAGGETLDLEIDGVPFTVTFDVADQSIAQVVARCNADSAFAGLDGFTAFVQSGQIRFRSLTAGSASAVVVTGGTAATALGFPAPVSAVGLDPTPNTSPVRLRRNADAASSQIETLKVYALLSVSTTSLYISNPSTTDLVRYRIAMGGDLVAPDPC